MNGAAKDFVALAATLLPETAALSLAYSRTLCREAESGGFGCAAYHAVWPHIRWFGLGGGPQRHKDFYRDALAGTGRDGGCRFLVSGAGDHSLPATVLWACAASGLMPELTVVDRCETPLRVCAWFGERAAVSIETVTADIMSYRAARPYDAIIAHSFLGYFPPAEWGGLASAWRDLLVPGGRVALVHRLRPGAPEITRFTVAQAAALREELVRRAGHHAAELDIPAEDFAALTDRYIAHMAMFSLRSIGELTAMFEGAGFRIESLTVDPIDPKGPAAPPGPTLPGGVEYVKLVAIRR